MKTYIKKVTHTLLLGLAILAVALLVYLGYKLRLTRNDMTFIFTTIACIYGIYLIASDKYLDK